MNVIKTIKFSCFSFFIALQCANAAPTDNQNKDVSLDDVKHFSEVFTQIKKHYVEPVDDKELFKNAIEGMLEGLDPHSAYLDTESYDDLKSSTKGSFGGLGIEVRSEEGFIRVISPIDDTPAYRAGVKAGDLIIRLDDKPVKGMDMREALNKMRGKKGTPIILTIYRKGMNKPLKLSIIRDIIRIQSVKSRLLEPGYGYIRISQFQRPTAQDMVKHIHELRKTNKGELNGIILDLRNNPGGLLTSAIDVSDAFLDSDIIENQDLIVYTKSRLKQSEVVAKATPGDILLGSPLVVLINEGSASGSEIVAGALQDHERAVVIGTKSFGKGSVQTVLPLDAKRGIKLTTALYYTPDGRSIQAKGIEPDIVLHNVQIKPKSEVGDPALSRILEKDLDGHIETNENKPKTDQAKQAGSETEDEAKADLAYKDFQLYQALNVLKGLHVAHQQANFIKTRTAFTPRPAL